MGEFQGTPGPWVRQAGEGALKMIGVEPGQAAVSGSGWLGLAVVNTHLDGEPSAEGAANLRAILAVPDVLDALRQLLEFWDNGTPVHPGALVVAEVREAYKKATEGTP